MIPRGDCRVLVVSNIPTPYNDSLYSLLARQRGIALKVAYGAARESNRLWNLQAEKGYQYVILRGITIGPLGRFNPGVFGMLRQFAPDVVVLSGSYAYPTMQVLSWWLQLTRVRWYYWGEELNWEKVDLFRRIVRLFRRPLRAADGILANGRRAAESFRRLGVGDEKIHIFHYYADTAHFALTPEIRARERRNVRTKHALPAAATVLLFMGELTFRKGLDTLLRAFAESPRDPNVFLLVVGDGDERRALQDLARDLGILDQVRFAGYAQPANLPSYAAAADALVVPSRKEGWGVVVSEAMAAGLPVIASDRVNSAADLVRDGESGFVFPVDNVSALASMITMVVRSPELRQTVAKNALAVMAGEKASDAAVRLARILCGGELRAVPRAT